MESLAVHATVVLCTRASNTARVQADERVLASWSGGGRVVTGRARLGWVDRAAVALAVVVANSVVVFAVAILGPPDRRFCQTYGCGSSGNTGYGWVVYGVFTAWAILSYAIARWRW